MKKNELIAWLEMYHEDLPVHVHTSNGTYEPTAIEREGDVLVLYLPYGITGEELVYLNVKNLRHGKENEHVVHNYLGESAGLYLYSTTLANGYNLQERAIRRAEQYKKIRRGEG